LLKTAITSPSFVILFKLFGLSKHIKLNRVAYWIMYENVAITYWNLGLSPSTQMADYSARPTRRLDIL
jgi:hypothetical protein